MWVFHISQNAYGTYDCKGVRNAKDGVSLTCAQEEAHRIYAFAYEFEQRYHTPAGQSLFMVITGANPSWNAEYHEESFGSWTITSPDGQKRFTYDGKDQQLNVQVNGTLIWEGVLDATHKISDAVFRQISP